MILSRAVLAAPRFGAAPAPAGSGVTSWRFTVLTPLAAPPSLTMGTVNTALVSPALNATTVSVDV